MRSSPMDNAAIQTSPSSIPANAITAELPPTTSSPDVSPPREKGNWLYRLLIPLASLRLTVILLFLGILQVFFGTLAMIDNGLYAVLHDYFRTGLSWIPFQLFVR